MTATAKRVCLAGGIAIGAGLAATGAWAIASSDQAIEVTTPPPTAVAPVQKPVAVPGTSLKLPASALDQVDLASLKVSAQADGIVHLIGTKGELQCLVATPTGGAGDLAAIACDTPKATETKGVYLATDQGGRLIGGAYAGTSVKTFSLSAAGGSVATPTANGTIAVKVAPAS